MPTLDTAAYQEVVDLLAPLMNSQGERRALLALALGHDSPVLRRLDLTGAVEPFVLNLISVLLDYGEVESGKPALWALLEVVRARVGRDRQARIDRLRSLFKRENTMNNPLFISYRTTDFDFALKLARDLLQAGYPVWMDRLHGILPGDEWQQSLQNGVTNSAGLLACLSRNYVDSEWCRRELQRAVALKKPIFPVLMGPVPDEVWPLEIQSKQFADFRNWSDEAAYRAALALLIEGIRKHLKLEPGPAIMLPPVGRADPGRDDPEDEAARRLAKEKSAAAPSARDRIKQVKCQALEQRFNALLEDYQAVMAQLDSELSEVARNKLKRQIVRLEQEMEQVKNELSDLGC